MRKVYLVGLLFLGIGASNLRTIDCCKTHRSHKKISTLSDKEKRSSIDLPYENANSLETNNQNTLTDLVKGLTLETSRKIKRNTPDFQNAPLQFDNEDSKNNQTTAPHTLMATLAHNDNNTDLLFDNGKIKRDSSDKLRLARDKKYMCHCKEAKCSECLQNKIQKSLHANADENTSAEVLDDTNLIQKTADGPKKFNIPFAQNVNFDQRVIVGSGEKLKPPANTYYPVYENSQVYHYTPYTMPHPGIVYDQNYAPTSSYNQFPSPSPIPAHLLKLWQNCAKNVLLADMNAPKKEYVPNYSKENKKSAPESGKVTTPRQVVNNMYWQNNYPHYTTEVINADSLKFISENPNELHYGDPTTTNYAPSYYTTKRTYSLNYQNSPQYDYNGVPNYQNSPQYDYNGVPNYQSSPQYDYNGVPTNKPWYQSQEEPNSSELSIEVDKVVNDLKYSAPTMSVIPNDADLQAYSQPETYPVPGPYNQPPDLMIQPPAWYNIENANLPSNTEINVQHRVTTLEDVNNGYTNHYNPQKTATLRDAKDYKVSAAATGPNSMEKLFRGLENIILNNVTVSDTPQVQAYDERPSTTYENTYRNPDTAVVQNAVKKVLNNFVPGKSEDLLANYGTERSYELTRHNAESLSPDLTKTQQVLKNLLNVPEVENMIVETTKDLINQVVGTSVPEHVIKDTLKNVVKEIPRPTTAPPKRDALKFEIRLAKRVPRYDETMERQVFEKIKSIIDKSKLGEEATHPLAQNLIVKTVKHSIDKERGVADEAAIRRAFNQLMKSKRPIDNHNNSGGSLIVQPKETMDGYKKGAPQDKNVYASEDAGYKLAPAIPVKERRLQGGVWVESPKTLTGNQIPLKSPLEEKRRKELEKQLDRLQKYNVKPNATYQSEPYLQKAEVTPRQAAPNSYYGTVTADPKNVQYNYSQVNNGYPINPVVTTVNYDYQNPKQQANYKNPSYANTPQSYNIYNDNPSYSNTPQPYNIYNENTSYAKTPQPYNIYYKNTSYANTPQPYNIYYENTNYANTPQPYNNQLNLLVDSSAEKKADGEPYMGRLVPVSPINGYGDSSNLVWVGDGVKLPLTMRKMTDGSFALTLSDEICKKFVHKRCPCCLPDGGQGVIVRERRNDESDFEDVEKTKTQLTNEASGNYRVRRESGEATTLKTFSNAIGKHDFEDADYDSTENDNSARGAPYKYQRYANKDRIISGRTRALGNMLKWMKDIVTEAHEKRQRRKSADKHKVSLF